jgi:hypothetical protein
MESLGREAWSGSTREKASHCCLLEVGYVLLTCTLIAISVRVRDLLAGCIVVLMYVARELCDEVGWQQFLVVHGSSSRATLTSVASLEDCATIPEVANRPKTEPTIASIR